MKEVFVPITIGGGIRSLDDIYKALDAGADKVALNSYATENPEFIKKAVYEFGSSTITINIEAKNITSSKWEVYKYYGREKTNIDLIDWIKKIQDYGCGEILLTSIDYEGMENGFDLELLELSYKHINTPLIISGGFGKIEDSNYIKKNFKNVSIAIASAFHYNKIIPKQLK